MDVWMRFGVTVYSQIQMWFIILLAELVTSEELSLRSDKEWLLVKLVEKQNNAKFHYYCRSLMQSNIFFNPGETLNERGTHLLNARAGVQNTIGFIKFKG